MQEREPVAECAHFGDPLASPATVLGAIGDPPLVQLRRVAPARRSSVEKLCGRFHGYALAVSSLAGTR